MNVFYMALVFSAIIFYRRLVLAHYEIYLDDYFSGIFKALEIAKVVMIGAFLRISRKFEHKPLIFFSFKPFFAFKELLRVLGKKKVRKLLLQKHTE